MAGTGQASDRLKLNTALTWSLIGPGHILYLAPGFYDYPDPLVYLNGTEAEPIRIVAEGGAGTVTLRPSSGARCLTILGKHDLTFEDIIFDAALCSSDAVKVTNDAVRITFRRCAFQNSPTQGALVTGTNTTAITFEDCVFANNGTTDLHHGLYIDIPGAATVRGCEAYGNSGHGLHIFGGAATGNTTLDGNYSHDNGAGIGVYYGTVRATNNICERNNPNMACSYAVANALIAHNTLANSEGRDLSVEELLTEGATVRIANNVCHAGSEGICVDMRATELTEYSVTVDHNLLSDHVEGRDYWVLGDDTHVTASDNTIASFTPVAGLKPTTGNPAIGAGATLDVTTDYGGVVRGEPPTLGAWEAI